MKEMNPFTFCGIIPNFDLLQNLVLSIPEEEWLLFKKRNSGAAAEKSDTIPLFYDIKNHLNNSQTYSRYHDFKEYIQSIVELCGVGSKIEQAMLTRLRSGVSIPRHKDKGEITAATHRIHAPIITNDKCIFTVDDESMFLPAGEVWIIDNVDKYHSVDNAGVNHRIHLILDVR